MIRYTVRTVALGEVQTFTVNDDPDPRGCAISWAQEKHRSHPKLGAFTVWEERPDGNRTQIT